MTRRQHSADVAQRILKDVVPTGRQSIIALEEEAFGIGSNAAGNDKTSAAQRIADAIEDANPSDKSWLLLNHQLRASQEKLENRWREAGFDSARCLSLAPEILIKRLVGIAKSAGIHWRVHALAQLEKFQNQTTPIDDWCRQFFDLGVGHIGRRIAMRLEVVEYGAFSKPFEPKSHDGFGQNVLHCYVNDGDAGGSWVSICDHLTHSHPAHEIGSLTVDPKGKLVLPTTDADEIVVYEDGLWSGSETVKRLESMSTDPIDVPVRLKFAVVTDFGLMVARHAARHFKLHGLVRIDANDARVERFLDPDLPGALVRGESLEPREYFKALHSHIVEQAFCTPSDWPEGFGEARDVTKLLGQQLVRHWYKRDRPGDDPEDGAEKFGLGGGGFAATIAFTRSVPKTCLPLLWLAGPVEYRGKSVNWQPLFKDVRRVAPALLET